MPPLEAGYTYAVVICPPQQLACKRGGVHIRTFEIGNLRHRFLAQQAAKLIGVISLEHATGRMIKLLGGTVSTTFPVQMRRALPTLGIFALLGVLGAAAAVIHTAVTEAEAKQPFALLILVVGLPGIWVVTVVCLATFSLRVTDDTLEKLLANRWVVSSKPLNGLRSASIVQNTLQLAFRDGTTLRIAAMPLRDQALLTKVLAARCPHVQIS
jgi:hypothetical protein